MSNKKKEVTGNANALFDMLMEIGGFRSDRQLAFALNTTPPVICKMRQGKARVNSTMILSVHEEFALSVADIRAAIAP